MSKFYKLTNQEVLDTLSLRNSEKDLLYYLRTVDPFGDGFEIITADIAKVLNKHRTTITRALNVLTRDGWLACEMKRAWVTVFPTQNTTSQEPPEEYFDDKDDGDPDERIFAKLTPLPKSPPTDPQEKLSSQQSKGFVSDNKASENKAKKSKSKGVTQDVAPDMTVKIDDTSTHQEMPPRINECTSASMDAHTHQRMHTRIKSKPKPSHSKDLQPSKTYSDYLRLIKTLSDEQQRERFLNFCRRMADQLPNPVMMLDKWIYANFDFLKAQYIAQTGERIIKADSEHNTVNNAVQQTEENQTQREVNNRGTVTKKVKQSLPEKLVEYLKQAIANKKIKNFWYCEPLRRWMVLLNNSASMEIEVFLSKYPPEAMQS